jgi:hypothetical protein
MDGVQRLEFTGSWTRHPVRDNEGHYEDDEDGDLPIAHSRRVFKSWITMSGTHSSSYSTHRAESVGSDRILIRKSKCHSSTFNVPPKSNSSCSLSDRPFSQNIII